MSNAATAATAAKLDAQILDRRLQNLSDQLESQRALVVFLQNQYKHMRGRLLESVAESNELREIIKLYFNFISTLKSHKNPTREEWRLILAYDRATALIQPSQPTPETQRESMARSTMSDALHDLSEESDEIENSQPHADVTVIKNDDTLPRSRSKFLNDHPNMEAILRFPLFASFPKDVVEQVSLSSYEMRRKQGQLLVKKGDEGAEIYFLTEGTVSVVVDDRSITDLQPYTFFGEMGVLFQFKRTATVMAKTNCAVVVVTKQKLSEIVAKSSIAQKLVDEFSATKESWWRKQQYIKSQESFGGEFANEIAREEIKKVAVFSSAPDSFCDKLAMRIKCLVFKANETIVKVGDESDAMYFILKGCVEVVGPSGCVNAEISNGSFFGEVGVLLNMKRTASIRAKEECNIFILNKKDLDEVVKAFPFMQNVLNEAAEERFQLFTKRTKESESGENDQHVPDQFDMEVGAQSLAKLSLFKSVEKSVLSELSMRMQRKNWQSGENIINADEIGNSMFFLAAGKADVITSFGELIDSVSGPSAYFGEVAIIEQVPRTASIRCTSTCSTYELRKEDFMAVIAKYPDIAKQIKESADERMQNYLMRSVLA